MYLYIPNNKGRLFIQNRKQREACCLPICMWWKGTAIRVRMGQAAQLLGCPCVPRGRSLLPFSSPLPLQQLWLAWRVVKLIQLSGGLFLAQAALHLTATQRALLSCCPGCCWFEEARASPWLCPRSHPLSQPAHRTLCFNPQPRACACLSSEDIFIPLSTHGYQRARCCCRGTLANLQAAALSPTGQGSQKERWMSVAGEEGWRQLRSSEPPHQARMEE